MASPSFCDGRHAEQVECAAAPQGLDRFAAYWPRVKGKVERGVGYIKRCFLEGRSFTDQRAKRGVLIDRRDRRDTIADEAHLVDAQGRLVARPRNGCSTARACPRP